MFSKDELIKLFKEEYVSHGKFGKAITDLLPLNNLTGEYDDDDWDETIDLMWRVYSLDDILKNKFKDKHLYGGNDEILIALSNEVINSSSKIQNNKNFYDAKFIDHEFAELASESFKGYRKLFKEITTNEGTKRIFEDTSADKLGIVIDKPLQKYLVDSLDVFAIKRKGIKYIGPRSKNGVNNIVEEISKVFREIYVKEAKELINSCIGLIRGIHKSVCATILMNNKLYELSPLLARDFMIQVSLEEENLKGIFKDFASKKGI